MFCRFRKIGKITEREKLVQWPPPLLNQCDMISHTHFSRLWSLVITCALIFDKVAIGVIFLNINIEENYGILLTSCVASRKTWKLGLKWTDDLLPGFDVSVMDESIHKSTACKNQHGWSQLKSLPPGECKHRTMLHFLNILDFNKFSQNGKISENDSTRNHPTLHQYIVEMCAYAIISHWLSVYNVETYERSRVYQPFPPHVCIFLSSRSWLCSDFYF